MFRIYKWFDTTLGLNRNTKPKRFAILQTASNNNDKKYHLHF